MATRWTLVPTLICVYVSDVHGRCFTPFVPTVAMLFITRGPLPHEQLWEEWFSEATNEVDSQCQEEDAKPNPIIIPYVHAPPDFEGYSEDSFFSDKLIRTRVSTAWHFHFRAIRELIRAALKEPSNQRFVLVSEACIPLYAAPVLYLQVMSQDRSSIGCGQGSMDRWGEHLLTRHFNQSSFQKSSEWWMLMRRHADIVANDQELWHSMDGTVHAMNEHYPISILLAWGELSHVDCVGFNTYVDWSGSRLRWPFTFEPRDVTTLLISQLRGASMERPFDAVTLNSCHYSQALEFSHERQAASKLSQFKETAVIQSDIGSCPVLARKFNSEVAAEVWNVWRAKCMHVEECSTGDRA